MKLATVVLAAGLGTRMKSPLQKVLHVIGGKPMVRQVAETLGGLKPSATVIVIGPSGKEVRDALKGLPVTFAVQKERKGTGDAFKSAVKHLKGFDGTLLVVSGDTPLVTARALQEFLKRHKRNREDISIMSFISGRPHSYGRIIRDGVKGVRAIVESRDATDEQKEINEVNSGIYALEAPLVNLLKEIRVNKSKGEYYLTDIVAIAVNKGLRVGAHLLGNERELTGINTREDLYEARLYLRDRVTADLAERGVTFLDRNSVFIDQGVEIGADTLIYPNVCIEGKTVIGGNCTIYPNTRIVASTLGNGVIVGDCTLIESSAVQENACVGPFAHIRPGSVIGASAKIGNFVEVKKSVIGDGAKASHLSYIGDAEIGKDVNIGAGTITCNYDGKQKFKTTIEDNVFIGSDTQLVAPVRVGKGAYVGAGSTITRDVPPHALAVSRTAQRNIAGWALKKETKAASRGRKTED
jgi:bifunctional UDP-N-acetylglucosamine pyrophosphorylase/glucosamine-1-phosphate N-acetyltransferase